MENPTRHPAVPPSIQDTLGQLRRVIEALTHRPEDVRLRRHAAEQAESLVLSCRRLRVRRATRAAQAIRSLVGLGHEDAWSIQDHLREKLLELLSLVQDSTILDAGKSG